MSDRLTQAVLTYSKGRADADGLVTTPVDGLTLMRIHAPTELRRTLYKPLVCIVLSGAKQVLAGDVDQPFAAGQSVIVSLDRPVFSRVVRASLGEPYLAVALTLDMALVREVLLDLPEDAASGTGSPWQDPAFFAEETREAVADCALRLVNLLDRPQAIPVLRAPIVKELHYWLLAGRHGPAIRRLAALDGHAERIARAIAVIRAEFARPILVERLAVIAGMSASSFHQHFKAATSLSPRQFQKQLRLLEARRLMAHEGAAASRAAFAVGYESVSQFTRDYGRMFGAPPRRDIGDGRAAA